MSDRRALVIHRLSPGSFAAAVRGDGVDDLEAFLEEYRRDAHRHHYGWYQGLSEDGVDARLLDRPSYVVPLWLLTVAPWLYARLLTIATWRFSPLRLLDAVLYRLHLLVLLLSFRPDYVLFLFDDLPRSSTRLCRHLGITTVTDFGDVPSSKPRSVKRRVLSYDVVTAGFELPRLWPAVADSFHRILPGPSRDSKFCTVDSDGPPIDVCVVGGYGGIFTERARILEALLERTRDDDLEIRVFGYENGRGTGSKLLGRVLELFGRDDITVPLEGYSYVPPLEEEYPRVAAALEGPVYGDDFYEVYDRAKIVLTIPNDPQIEIGSIRPMGIFEPAAAGTFQLALDSPDTRNTFDPGREIGLFEDADDLYDQIQYFLEHPAERQQIAGNSNERFLAEYTAESQIRKLISDIDPIDE